VHQLQLELLQTIGSPLLARVLPFLQSREDELVLVGIIRVGKIDPGKRASSILVNCT